MLWLNKFYSVKKTSTKRIITILGFHVSMRRSFCSRIARLVDQNQEILKQLAYFKARDFFMQHYQIKIPAECCGVGERFELVKVKLKDIKRLWADGKIYQLEQCSPYRYLQTRDGSVYEDYLKKLVEVKHTSATDHIWSLDTFHQLEDSIAGGGYDPTRCAIAITHDNLLVDGQHRCALLLQYFGPEYEIYAVRVS